MKVLYAIVLLLAALCASPAFAQVGGHDGDTKTALVEWVHPTEYVDGTPLPLAQIRETRITYTHVEGRLAPQTVVVPAPSASVVVSGLFCGSFRFSAVTVAISDDASDPTQAVLHNTTVTCSNKPNPPTAVGAR